MPHQIDRRFMKFSLLLCISWQLQACRTLVDAASSESASSSAGNEREDFEEARLIFNGAGPTQLNGVKRGDAFVLASEGKGKLMSEVLDESRNSWYQKGETCTFEGNHRIDIVGFADKGDRALVLYHAPWKVKEQACVDGSYFFMPIGQLKGLEKCRPWWPQKNCIYREDNSNGIEK